MIKFPGSYCFKLSAKKSIEINLNGFLIDFLIKPT